MAAEPFLWGRAGTKLTPDQIAKEREMADALAKGAMDYSPVGHWSQGLNRVAQGLLAGLDYRNAERAEGENATYNSDIINSLLGASSSPVAATSMPTTTGAGEELAATSPAVAQPLDMSGNEVFGQFIDTVKQGGVQNPYALAAIAATGKAESGFDPKNATRTWSDPSESGQPGTAGGIMSWRGPRYQALAATGDLSPAGQAKFFLQENPQLIQSLNSAKSVEEAQSLMNNAWQFAGYDRPGGEASRRLQLASSFLPTFQNTEVAAASPQAAIEAAAPVSGYVDPMVSAPNSQPTAQTALAPELPPPVEVAPPPAVASVPPQRVAQALASPQPQAPAINPAILKALSDPRATPQTRAVAQALMQQDLQRQQAAQEMQMKQQDPRYQQQLQLGEIELQNARNPQPKATDDMREYEFAKQQGFPGSFVDFQLAQRKAGATNVTTNVGEGDKFYENLDKKNAETFAAMSDAGIQARSKIAQIDRLEGLMANAPQGAVGALKQAAGEWGIPTEGLSDIQAASALLEKMVPEQRAPGTGPMSDADIKMFRSSLPRIIGQPGGNQLIFQTMRGIAQYEQQMGEIADQVANREIKPAEGRKLIQQLENPLSNFKLPGGPTPNEGWKEIAPNIKFKKLGD